MLDVLIWGSVLIGVIVVGGFAVLAVRKHLLAKDAQASGFSIESLEDARNQLTDEEFRRLRRKTLGVDDEKEPKSSAKDGDTSSSDPHGPDDVTPERHS